MEEKYSLKEEIRIYNAINKIFKPAINPKEKTEYKKKHVIMNNIGTIMIIANTKRAKKIINKYIEKEEENTQKIPEINYQKEISKSYFETNYLTKCLTIIEKSNTEKEKNNLLIETGKDMPITITNKDFKIIIAPKVGDDLI